jgi:hypothetical protein
MTEGGLPGGRTLGKLTSIVGCFGRKLKPRRSCGPLRVIFDWDAAGSRSRHAGEALKADAKSGSFHLP